MVMRVGSPGSNNDPTNLNGLNANVALKGSKSGESGTAAETKGPLQYGGENSNNVSSFRADYKTLIDKLVKQGYNELNKMKEALAKESSPGEEGASQAASESHVNQGTMKQLQMLLDNISKLLQQSQQDQHAPVSKSKANDAQLGNAVSQLKELLSSLGVSTPAGSEAAPAAEATAASDSTTANGAETSATALPKDEKDTSVRPSSDTLFKNMDGDNRSADQIINDNPVLKNLGNQKDIKQEDLKKQFGDWTANNPDEKSRALAAKNMSWFLNSVKSLDNREGGDRGDVKTNGKIEGLTKDGDARHGTEAAIVKDVAEQGLDKMFPQDGKLTQTNDKMVNTNGTNKSGFQGICLTMGKALAFIPGLSNALIGMGRSESTNPWDVIKGGVGGAVKTTFDALKGALDGIGKGKLNPAQMLISAYKGAVMDTYAMQDVKSDAKDKVKELL